MLTAASKYSSPRAAAAKAGRASPPKLPSACVPILKKPYWQDLHACARYAENENRKERGARGGLNIHVPSFHRLVNRAEWFWRGLRGPHGWLNQYLDYQKRTTAQRFRNVARQRAGHKQNNKSDVRLAATLPLADYIRIRKFIDNDYFEDKANLKRFKRDNPDFQLFD